MPRQARVILDNVCYHVITRCNQQQAVFKDTSDFRMYMKFLSKYKKRYKFKLYGWCLMENHVHLLLKSDKLIKAMHGISLSYAQYFQNKYSRIGHFWQDRYKSFVIQEDEYLVNCISYIEYNPLRANLVLRPENYPWSSYGARVLGKRSKRLLDSIELWVGDRSELSAGTGLGSAPEPVQVQRENRP